jgi:adenylate kinase
MLGDNKMNLIFMGPPGAGKGTQADNIIEQLKIPHISTGDMFRDAIAKKTAVGLEAKKYMDKGQLVPDDVTIKVVEERLADKDTEKGFLLDGFPRTIPQAEALDEVLKKMNRKIDKVINLEVPFDLLIKRITGRRVCEDCSATYHVEFNPPKVPGVCDKCGGRLIQRSDDNLENATKRLETYNKQTKPLIDYYAKQGNLTNIDGSKDIDVVSADIFKALKGVK